MAFRDVLEGFDDLRDAGLSLSDPDAAFEHGELGLGLLHRRVEHRQLQADRIDLRAVRAEVFFSEGEGLDVLGAGELHAVRDAVGLGGGEAVFEFGQQGFFVGLRHRFNGIFIH